MLANFESITDELITALGEEIDAIKESGGSEKIGIHDGRYIGKAGARFLYCFLLDAEFNIPLDTPAQLHIDKDSHEAIIVSVQGFKITLSIKDDVGPTIPKAILSLSPYFLLQQLQRRIEEIHTGVLPANKESCMQLFGFTTGTSFSGVRSAADPGNLNKEQLEAVNRCLQQRVTFIWGPPGTGKTRTIGTLVKELVRRGERLLVTSHTNVAVDTALLPAIKALSENEIHDGIVVRVGALAREDPILQRVTMEAVLNRKSQDLLRQQERIKAESKVIQGTRNQLVNAITLIERVAKTEQRVAEARDALARAGEKVKKLEKDIAQARRDLGYLQSRLQQAEAAGFFRRVLFGLNPEAIRRQIVNRDGIIMQLESACQAAREEKRIAGEDLSEAPRV